MTRRAEVAAYVRLWNTGAFEGIRDIAHADFAFRGALGNETRGFESFMTYGRSTHESLEDYYCDVHHCVSDGDWAFAKMRYRGRHVRPLLGFQPTRLKVEWLGAALFEFHGGKISELWVLSDLHGLRQQLNRNKALVDGA